MINTINQELCTGCGTCLKTCGLDVFRLDTNQNTISPCSRECPAGTDMRAYNALMQLGMREEAAQKLKERNPFPAITGRVCPHPCEKKCSRAEVDGAVNINAVEQYLGDLDLDTLPERPAVRHLAKVAVAGSGPAGLSCAWFLAQMGYPVTVFEAASEPGGMLRWGIPAYRLPTAVIDAQIRQLRSLGVRFVCNTRIGDGCDISLEELGRRGFKAVFLAPGAALSRRAQIPGEEAAGVFHGLEFLRAARTPRDASVPAGYGFKPGCSVVVVGGGDVAMDAAITAARMGAGHVELVCLEDEETMPAFPHNIEDARNAGVLINAGWGPVEVTLADGHAKGLKIRKCLSVFDENHKFAPRFDDDTQREIAGDIIIFAIGQTPDFTPFPELKKVTPGRLEVDPVTFNTSIWNVFAAGDAVSGPSSVISAIAGGREGAISIDRLLKGAHLHSDRTDTRKIPETLPGKGVLGAPRNERTPVKADGFGETRKGLDTVAALDESMRCLTCGAKSKVTYRDDCMTCYFCELRCPSDAIDVFPFKERLPYTIESNTHAW